jgi:hypothetical protein
LQVGSVRKNTSEQKHSIEIVAYLLVQFVILVVFYFPWLSNRETYFFRDLTHFIEPLARFTGGSMRQLEMPLWNPWLYCGMPQVGLSLQGISYLPTCLFALMPFASALASNMILHQSLCGLGGFLLVSSLGWGLLPSLLCGSTLAFSGYSFSLSSIFSLVGSSSWGLLSLWAFLEAGKKENWSDDGTHPLHRAKWTFLAALMLAMLIMSGYHDITSTECLMIGAFILISAFNGWRQSQKSFLPILFFRLRAVFLGTLLSLPALLPTFEWVLLSRRSTGLDPKEALLLSANWYDLICMIAPQPLGDLQMRWAEFRPLVMPGQMVPYLASSFVGPVVLTFAIWSLSDKEWKERWWVLSVFAFTLLLSLGENTFFVPLLMSIVKAPVRFPIKQMFFPIAALAIMSARGLFAFLQGRVNSKLSLIFWLAILLFSLSLINGLHPLDNFLPSSELVRKAEYPLGMQLLIASISGLLISGFGTFLFKKERSAKQFALAAIVLSTGFLLYAACAFCRSAAPADFFEKPAALAKAFEQLEKVAPAGPALKDSRYLGLYQEHFTVPPGFLPKDNLQASINTYQYSRQVLRPNTNIDSQIASSFGFEGSATGEYFHFFQNCYDRSSQAYPPPARTDDRALACFCKMTATKYALTQIYRFGEKADQFVAVPPLDSQYFADLARIPELNIHIYKVNESLARSYFADSWRWEESHEKALEDAFDPGKSGFDPAVQTLVEFAPDEKKKDGGTSVLEKISRNSQVSIKEDKCNSLLIEVNASQAGFLVLADQFYPGWTAQVDGKPAQILRANCFGRAVELAPGKHLVSFNYRPASFYWGLALAAVSASWMLILFVIELKGRRNAALRANQDRKMSDE